MAIVTLMNKDETGTAPENKVTGEAVQVTKGAPQSLAHTFFFEDGFALYSDASRAHKLQRGRDFNFAEEDTIATEISNKNCWRKIVIYKDIAVAYADYQVYGDVVSAETINDINGQIGKVAANAGNIDKLLKDTKQDLINHKADTAPHGASTDAVPNSLALRTAAGTLKAHDAVESDDLINLKVLNQKQQAQDAALQGKISEAKSGLLEKIQAKDEVITNDEMDDDTLDPNAPNYEEQLSARLENHVNDLKPHRNAIRNKDGNLTTGQATLETEAVNKKQLDKAFSDLVGAAPETLDTIHEIADALKGNANIVNTITDTITAGDNATLASAKSYTDTKVTDALNTAEDDATTKANAAKQGAVAEAKSYTDTKASAAETNAANYTNTKLADYYTKTEVDESQEAQDTRIAALEAAPTGAGTVYDFSRTEAVKTGDKIKLANGTVKDVYRLCVEKENASEFFTTTTITPTQIFNIKGTARIDNTILDIYETYSLELDGQDIYFTRKDNTKTYTKVYAIVEYIV